MSETRPTVAVLLVSHDGARWLPAVLESLEAQDRRPDRVLGVDTGSADESGLLLDAACDDVLRLPAATGYPTAVRSGLERLALHDTDLEWVWLLHDDSAPAPGALAELLAAAAQRPDVDVLGPKLREWPSLRRLLELGVTISGTGHRETGLERGEYDQGQHDERRTVLAVNTAGMLVRRRVLEELGGFDEQLPIFGNDIDFGWRAADAGHSTLVVPEAVVFHAEAAHRGVRRTALTGRHTQREERRAALYTLLVNGRGWALPLTVLRLTLGTMVRMVGFLLVRSVGEAVDDAAALIAVLTRPGRLLAGRRDRRERRARGGSGAGDPDAVRRLLAPPWLPYRHGLDFLSDLAAAATNQAADVAERRRAASAERDPSSVVAAARRRVADDDDELFDEPGLLTRYLTDPVALALTAFVVVALVGARTAFGDVAGGAMSPVPADAGDWWALHVEAWHPLGQGTDAPAPAYVLPLALLALVLGTGGAVSALLLLAVPVGLWGAWRFLRVVGRLVDGRGLPRWLLAGGAATYALVPVTSGAWGDGRLGVVAAAALLPWLAHAALGFGDPDPDRRWRAAWRVGLLLALASAFAPSLWLVAAILATFLLVAGVVLAGSAARSRSAWGPPATAVGVPLVLLSPWWIPTVLQGSAGLLLADTGRLPSASLGRLDLLLGRLGDSGAPSWWGAGLLVLAVLALLPRTSRLAVVLCWLVALVASLVGLGLTLPTTTVGGVGGPLGVGPAMAVVQGALVCAAFIGGQAVSRRVLARRGRVAVAALAVVGAAVPLAGAAWFVVATDQLTSQEPSDIPEYMVQSSATGPERGVLLVRGDVAEGLRYSVRREDGVTLGEDEILAATPEDEALGETVDVLLSRPTVAAVERLGDLGVEYVVLAAPVDGDVAATLDATAGLTQASAASETRAWQVDRPLATDVLDGPDSPTRSLLLVVQGLAVLAVAVLGAPTLRGRRRP